MWSSFLFRFIIVCVCAGFLKSEDIPLKCDSWDKDYINRAYYDHTSGSNYCTITGLNVSHTQNVFVEIPEWMNYNSVGFVKFYDSSLLYIPQTICSAFSELKNLDVSDSGVIEITRNTFISATKLNWLNTSQNAIREITGSVFMGASNLRDLDMSRNQIEKLSEYSFNGLKHLVNLDLSTNSIVNVEKNLFSDNAMLETLDLRNNKIDHISAEVFVKLPALTMIDLSENSLTHIEPTIFERCPNLRVLWISSNKLSELHLNVGEYFKGLQADHNDLNRFSLNCTGGYSNQFANSSCSSLKKLRLSNNKLQSLNNLTRFHNLKELRLSHNNVGKLNISTFAKLNQLEILDLRNTNLSGITFGTFAHQNNLTFLDISDNHLGHLNLDVFLPYLYRYLEEFYVSGNNLTEIKGRHSFLAFSSLKKLGLGRNHFNCSYLLHLTTFPNTNRQIDYPVESSDESLTNENIHGIQCTHKEGANHLENKLTLIRTTSLPYDYEKAFHRLQLHERQLEQHLLLMRSFVVIISVLGLFVIAVTIFYLVTKNRSTWINTISYRSTNTIQSEVDIP